MQRRSAIRSTASIVASAALVGSTAVGSTRHEFKKVGVKEFERETKKIAKKHNGVKNGSLAVKPKNSDISTSTSVKKQNGIEDRQDISVLYDDNIKYGSIENVVFNDGYSIRQEVTSEDMEVLDFTVGDRQFRLDFEEVKNTLRRRMADMKSDEPRLYSCHNQIIPWNEPQTDGYKTDIHGEREGYQSSDWSADDFVEGYEETCETPVTGSLYSDVVNENEVHAAASAAAAGHGGVKAGAVQTWSLVSGDLGVEYSGEYGANWGNATATSFIELRLFIEKQGEGRVREADAFNKHTFLADLGSESDDFEEGLFISDIDEGVYAFGMEAEVGATAIGYTSITAVAAATQPGGDYDGGFFLDEWVINDFYDLIGH